MAKKDYALIGGSALLGAALVTTVGIHAEDKTSTGAPAQWQVAANETTGKQRPDQAGISMEAISRRMAEKYEGHVTEIELERERSGDVYEIEIKTPDGYEWEVEADAKTGEILTEKRERDD